MGGKVHEWGNLGSTTESNANQTTVLMLWTTTPSSPWLRSHGSCSPKHLEGTSLAKAEGRAYLPHHYYTEVATAGLLLSSYFASFLHPGFSSRLPVVRNTDIDESTVHGASLQQG